MLNLLWKRHFRAPSVRTSASEWPNTSCVYIATLAIANKVIHIKQGLIFNVPSPCVFVEFFRAVCVSGWPAKRDKWHNRSTTGPPAMSTSVPLPWPGGSTWAVGELFSLHEFGCFSDAASSDANCWHLWWSFLRCSHLYRVRISDLLNKKAPLNFLFWNWEDRCLTARKECHGWF